MSFPGAPGRAMNLFEVKEGLKMPSVYRAAAPMRVFKVLAITTFESLQRGGAECCVPVGLVSTLMCNYTRKIIPAF